MDTNSFRQREESRQGQLRKIYDFVMGLIWTAAGIFFITAKYIADGLGLDSVDIVSVISQVERQFKIRLSQADLEQISTVGQVLDLIVSKTSDHFKSEAA